MAQRASKHKAKGGPKRKTKGSSKRKAEGVPKPRAPPVEVELPPIFEDVQRDLEDSWRKDDQLLDKFFPVDPTSHSGYTKARRELFNEDKRFQRWKGILANPKPLSRLYTPLTTLMNRILFHYKIRHDERLFLNTHVRRPSNSTDMEPDIFLAGVGPEFANNSEPLPRFEYPSGICPFVVSLDSEDQTAARNRLAVHVHEIFQCQETRRFVYGVLLTQNTFTVFMFDHSGAVASPPCNYHAHPDRFCAIISRLASRNEEIGFDNTVFSDGRFTKIRTLPHSDDDSAKEAHYIVRQLLFRFDSLVGRGTVCWLTSGPDDKSAFVVKDAWIAASELAGRESEGSLLRHAQSQGVVAGIAQIHHFEEVRRTADPSDLDTVSRNRRVTGTSAEDKKIDRVHTRLVLATYGKPFDEFSTRMELLLAFYDAVLAHRQLHDVAGILHRDISVRNILINPDGVEGNRGILIDFDHSIRVGDTSPYSIKTKIGTWRYMSRAVLKEAAPHSYLDDLESFYYVLCWILGSYESAGVPKAKIPEYLKMWDSPRADIFKHGQSTKDFKIPISPWFGKSLRDLALGIHNFFRLHKYRRRRTVDPESTDFILLTRSPLDPTEDYDAFLSLIRTSISSLEKEDILEAETALSPEPSVAHSKEPPLRKRKCDSLNDEHDVGPSSVRSSPQPLWPEAPAAPSRRALRSTKARTTPDKGR